MARKVGSVVKSYAASPVVYTTLDLSDPALAGPDQYLCIFKCRAGNNFVAFKPGPGSGVGPPPYNGADPHAENWHYLTNPETALTGYQVNGGGHATGPDRYWYSWCITDDQGYVRYICANANNLEITLEYVMSTTALWSSLTVTAGVSVDNDLNGLGITGGELLFLKSIGSTNQKAYYPKPLGETRAPYGPCTAGNSITATIGNVTTQLIPPRGGHLLTESQAASVWTSEVACYCPDWVDDNAHGSNPVKNANTTGAKENVDISAIVGAKEVVALIRVQHTTDSINDVNAGFSQHGDANTWLIGQGQYSWVETNYQRGSQAGALIKHSEYPIYLIAITDPSGITDLRTDAVWPYRLDVLGHEEVTSNIPPVCTWTAPAGPGILPGAILSGTTTDPDDGIDVTATQVTITHDPLGAPTVYNAIVNGVVQAPFIGTCDAAGFSITMSGGMPVGPWTSLLSCTDDGGLTNTAAGAWTTIYAEYFINQTWDDIKGGPVTWRTLSVYDPTGASYPGPGVFGVDTSFYTGFGSYYAPPAPGISFVNQVWDAVKGGFVTWVSTSDYDAAGTSYPGPGVFGVDTSFYVGKGYYY